MAAFTTLWEQIDEKKKITETGRSVTMTPEQFKKMLQQFYDQGYKQGERDGRDKGVKSAKDLQDLLAKNKSGLDFSGLDFGNLFNQK